MKEQTSFASTWDKESGNHDRDNLDFSDSPCRMNLSRCFEIQEPNLSDVNSIHTRSMKKSASFHCPSMEMASPEATMTKSPSFLGGTPHELNEGDENDDFFYVDTHDDDDYGQYDAPVMFGCALWLRTERGFASRRMAELVS